MRRARVVPGRQTVGSTWWPAGAAVVFAIVACGENPQVARERLVRSGDDYLARNQVREAVLQYRKAAQQDPQDGETRRKLAETYMRLGELQNAYGEYIRAADLLPEDAEVQVQAGNLLLVAGRFEDALARADRALALSPANADAHILRANALAGSRKLEDAIEEFEQTVGHLGEYGPAYTALGTLQFRGGNRQAAEAAYRKAVELDPAGLTARLALANFYWAMGRPAEAEPHLKAALATEPTHPLANRVLGWFYVANGRPAEAERHFKILADVLPEDSGKLLLAAYYVAVRRFGDAHAVLEPLAKPAARSFVPATLMLARIALAIGDPPRALRAVDDVLARHAGDADALLLKAELLSQQRRFDEAVAAARAAVGADANSAVAQLRLGQIHAVRREYREAFQAFSRAIQLNPRLTAAQIELAHLHLLMGETDPARALAESVLRSNPGLAAARLLLARVERQAGNLAAAERELTALTGRALASPAVQIERGRLEHAKGNPAAARAAFERVLATDPTNVEALVELTALDFRAGRIAAARARLDAAVQQRPDDAQLLMASAHAYAELGAFARAEGLLRRALAADPAASREALTVLARLYLQQGRADRAVREFQTLAERNPRWAVPHVMMAMIFQGQNRRGEAKEHYRRALAIDSGSALAANNLAFMYAEDNERLDEALQLAQAARERMPDAPETADTLGWVYYKKDLPSLAVQALREAVDKAPENASFRYRLGLAYVKNGEFARARQTLESALKHDPTAPMAAEARAALARLAALGS